MKNIAIIGAGTAGTMTANHLRGHLPSGWKLTVIDPESNHLYQPGLLFLPFGAQDENKIVRRRKQTLGRGVDWVQAAVETIDPDAHTVVVDGQDPIRYDKLVIATGSHIRPEETEGLLGDEWGRTIHNFYTLDGAIALREAFAKFQGGRVVLNVAEMPIKCPVAPLEFLFLADDYFKKRGIRDKVELVYATPLDGAFTKPAASRQLGHLLEEKGINVETEFNLMEVDAEGRAIVSFDERRVDYDLLVSIPTHMGASFIEGAGLGNELSFIPTNRHTLEAQEIPDAFVLGDATDLPSSKAGSVAHFQSGVVAENMLRSIRGLSPLEGFDGHANCFIESGGGKALLIDFNYNVEPLPGRYPLPWFGPFQLLGESRMNHIGKLGFRWLYWNMLLPARPLPIGDRMSMAGKQALPAAA